MADQNYTFSLDEKLMDRFKKKAESEQRTIAGQIRYLMEACVENRIQIPNVKEPFA